MRRRRIAEDPFGARPAQGGMSTARRGGCSAHEIMSISGHVTLQEVQRYTAAADRARLAKRAMATVIKARPKVSKKNEV
jgi:hypothetical protein